MFSTLINKCRKLLGRQPANDMPEWAKQMLADKEFMEGIRIGAEQIARGESSRLEDVKKRLGDA